MFVRRGRLRCAAGLTAHLLAFLRLAARNVGLLVVIFLLASTGLFFAIRAVPGDPIALRLKNPDPERIAQERARLGLDEPLSAQWWFYVRSFVAGDWGRSFQSGRTVRAEVAQFFPATIELSLAALALGIVIGVVTAVCAEVFRLAALRRLAFVLGTIGLTVPIFWIGLLAIIVGSLWLGWFPSSGRFDLAAIPPPVRTGLLTIDALLAGDIAALATAINFLAVPALCLALYPAAQICGVLRARLQDRRLQTLQVSLRARGLAPARVWLRHILKIVSAPIVTVIGSNFGALLGGAVLTETVFSWPGIGRYLVNSVITRDLYVVQNVLLLVILLVVVIVFVADFAALLLNPLATGADGDDAEEGKSA